MTTANPIPEPCEELVLKIADAIRPKLKHFVGEATVIEAARAVEAMPELTALQDKLERLEGGLREIRTSICGYNLHDADDAFNTVAAFHKEIMRMDAIARSVLGGEG